VYGLNSSQQSEETLRGLRSAGDIFFNIDGSEELTLILSDSECRVFHNIVHRLNGEALQSMDVADYEYNTHISEWCVLFVLASRLGVSDLADAALEYYQTCRMPHWQGCWLPLPCEIEFLWHNSSLTAPMRNFVTRHLVSQMLTQRCQANLGDLAVLLSCDVGFILDVLRELRIHLTVQVGATEFCGIEFCTYHVPTWTQSDVDEAERQLSESEFSERTEPLPWEYDHRICSDEEEAFAAAEVLDALFETRHT